MTEQENSRRGIRELGTRPKIGQVDGNPVTSSPDLDALSPRNRALRQATIDEFLDRRLKKHFEKQVRHVNTNRQLAEEIQLLFDSEGNPPENAPLEDIVEQRRALELQARWIRALLAQVELSLAQVREFEDSAFARLGELPLED